MSVKRSRQTMCWTAALTLCLALAAEADDWKWEKHPGESLALKSAETVHTAGFDIQDVAVHEGNYYFRWVMDLTTKRWKDEPITTVGMSHVRFDRDGRVTFHQDYWDTSVVYEKVPVMGSVIRWIRRQF